MLSKIEKMISKKWSILIGRPRLTLSYYVNDNIEDFKCKNITCGKTDRFKKYKDNKYICECGYIIEGDFYLKQHKTKLYCNTKICPENKKKMDKECLRCEFIRER